MDVANYFLNGDQTRAAVGDTCRFSGPPVHRARGRCMRSMVVAVMRSNSETPKWLEFSSDPDTPMAVMAAIPDLVHWMLHPAPAPRLHRVFPGRN